jgi:tRNA A-37 threonylcarbamoyl transferase component Bud32
MPEALAAWAVEATLATGPGRIVLRARHWNGGPVVLKVTPPGAAWAVRADLRREARLLERCRGDGVVDLLEVIDRRGRTALVLGFVPAGTLATRPAPDPGPATRRLEVTVDRLHRSGVVHGALGPEHVVLDADGLPVLVGFGTARRSPDTTLDAVALALLQQALRPGA